MSKTTLVAVLLILATTLGASAQSVRPFSPGPIEIELREVRPLDLHYAEPAPLQTILDALGPALGIALVTDPNFRDRDLTIDLRGLAPQEALTVLARAASVFYKPLASDVLLVANDTPQNRRSYQELGVRIYYLQHAPLKDMMTALRSILQIKSLAAIESQNAIVVRDSGSRLALVEKLVQSLDGAPGGVELDVHFYDVDRAKLDRWAKSHGRGLSHPLEARAVKELLGATDPRVLATPTMNLVGSRSSRFETKTEASAAGPSRALAVELRLGAFVDDGVQLETSLAIAAARLETGVALRAGNSVIVRPGAAAGAHREIVVLFTAHSVEPPALSSQQPVAWWVGTEASVQAPVRVVKRQ